MTPASILRGPAERCRASRHREARRAVTPRGGPRPAGRRRTGEGLLEAQEPGGEVADPGVGEPAADRSEVARRRGAGCAGQVRPGDGGAGAGPGEPAAGPRRHGRRRVRRPVAGRGRVTAFQRRTPAAMMGRVSGVLRLALTIPQAASIGIGAALITVVSYRALLVVIAVAAAASGLFVIGQPGIRRRMARWIRLRRWPTAPPRTSPSAGRPRRSPNSGPPRVPARRARHHPGPSGPPGRRHAARRRPPADTFHQVLIVPNPVECP